MEPVLDIKPSKELVFKGPFNREVTAQLRLTNPTDKHICFSFWEGRYRVHPQFGILGPSKAIVTAVILPPFGKNQDCDVNEKYELKLRFAHITNRKSITSEQVKQFWEEVSTDAVKTTSIACKYDGQTSENVPVVGIDIGSTYTKCVFSHASIYTVDPTLIWAPAALLCFNEFSTANQTVVLLDDNEQFKSFGADAINEYEIDEQGHLFREVKKPLYNNLDGEVIYIKDELGRKTPAVKVISPIIKRIKYFFNPWKNICGFEVRQDDIIWVITVPPVFTAEAILIVKNAAIMAGIAENKLSIILEHEATLEYFYGMHKHTQPERTYSHASFPNGKQFMVVDIGVETLDITVVEKDEPGTLKELYKFCGVGYGGKLLHTTIDKVFTTIVGPEEYQRFRTENCHEYRWLHRCFEDRLKKENSNSTKTFRICVSGLIGHGREREKFVDNLKKSHFAGEIFVCQDKLNISAEFWKGILGEFSGHIHSFVKAAFTEQACDKNMHVFIAGGYAEFKIIQESFIREFPYTEIYFPQVPQHATVQGAVLLGHMPPSNIELANATKTIIKKIEDGDDQDNDDSSLQGLACGGNLLRRITEMSKSSDFLGDVVVHSFSKFQAGVTSLKLKLEGRPQEVCVKRKDIITDVITAYRDIDVHRPLKVHFDDDVERRDVTKEMFGLFWEKISNVWFKGENAVIPLVPVAKRAEARHVFPVLGKILEHTLCILGHFPPQICRSLIFAIAYPDKDVNADLVLEDYLLYLPERESELLSQSLKQTELSENRKKRLERFFSVNNFSLQPTPTSLREDLLNVAYAEIIDSSHVYMCLMRRGISDFAKTHVFDVLDTDTLNAEYRAREVTTEKVAQMVEAMLDKSEYSREDRKIINYASNFVSELSKKQLRQFLTWLTGSPNMPQKIEITFNTSNSLTKTPKVHRDKNILELSRDYRTYQDFKRDIMGALLNESSV